MSEKCQCCGKQGKIPAFQIIVGDLIDLEGDPFADPKGEHIEFESQLQEVVEVTDEGGCIAIAFEGFDIVGFPRNHLLKLEVSSPNDPAA